MDIRSKLNMYKSSQVEKPVRPQGSGLDVHDLMTGTICTNDDGSCFIIEKEYPVTYIHGGFSLGDALDVNMHAMKRVCADLDSDASISGFLFLDTETTGLSGGTGTVAFLVGTGFFKDDRFVLRQYFMRDYNEEPSMVRELNRLMEGYKGLVTFNGKAFDWNILQTRFTFNRIKPALRDPLNIDLLYPSRRIWKLKLESCRLSSLEENILGECRVDDIPGALIPSIYFKYLDDRNATEIVKVIRHNELDILSMVSLLVKIGLMLENPLAESDGEHELLGMGRIFELGGENNVTIDCYESCLKSDDYFIKEAASKRLVGVYKRNKDYRKVVEHCEYMLSVSGEGNISILIELAKHYEHRERDIPRAIGAVEKAVQKYLSMGLRDSIYYEELRARLERLKRKQKKLQNEKAR